MKSALLLVDVQNDFTPGGALGVPGGDEIIPTLNSYIEHCRRAGMLILASRDWHPRQTVHFRAGGGLWPPHCIQGTAGAYFHSSLRLPADTMVVSKGMNPNEDAYSAFQAKAEDGTLLPDLLKSYWIGRLYIGGLATDYCVRSTVLDASAQGFKLEVLADGIRGINLAAGDIERAIADMVAAGAQLTALNRFATVTHTE